MICRKNIITITGIVTDDFYDLCHTDLRIQSIYLYSWLLCKIFDHHLLKLIVRYVFYVARCISR